MEPPVRYCTTSDGVSIAFAVNGEGPPLLICPAIVESFSLRHPVRALATWHDQLARHLTVIRYDMRGTGLSQRDGVNFSTNALVSDIEAVIRSIGLQQVAICAPALGGPRAIVFAARYPTLVSHLILIDTLADTADTVVTGEAIDALAHLARTNWHLAAQTLADMGGRGLIAESRRHEYAELSLREAEITERSVGGESCAAMLQEGFASWNCVAELRRVVAPTLVLHHEENFLIPIAAARRIAAGIAGASLVTVKGVTLGPTRDADQIPFFVDTVHKFMGVRSGNTGRGSTTGVVIILFTDIADSTALTERIGDAAFRDKARALDAALRSCVRDHGGAVIDAKTLGDGILATFAVASQAIASALDCKRAGENAGLPLHVGLHAGDVIREQNNVFGGAVNIAARISGLSAPGEVLVSDIVRGLARTSAGVTFDDRGEHALKGVGEPQRVYAVRGQA